jgi:hypothetical protein
MTHNQIAFAFDQCQKALQALTLIVNKPTMDDRAYIDATIQRFEFTIELLQPGNTPWLFKPGDERATADRTQQKKKR